MKLSYLWIAAIALPFIACKKDKLATENPTTKPDDYTICADDSWSGSYEFKGHIPSFIFTYNNKAYVPRDHGMGLSGDRRVYIFDGSTWTDIATSNPHPTDLHDAAFTIGSKGYVIFASGAQHQRMFYEYNIITNVWTRKADYPGSASHNASTFTIGTKGYVVGGDYSGEYSNETWEYNPATDTWRERKSLFLPITLAAGFSIGGKGYITNGKLPNNLGYYYSLVEYDPATNNWTSRASYPGDGRIRSQYFVVGDNAYVGGGTNSGDQLLDFYKYTPSTNSWARVDDIPPANSFYNGFSINEKGFVVCNGSSSMIRYNPRYCTTIHTGPAVNMNN